ncbi:MAG TPA: response regulator, partial [Polyangia bacterium]|nr:response regulator [Polyangia bacterium]
MSGYVLIVERDPDLQRKMGDALKEAGYELASEGEMAWAQRSIAVRAPDAIVIGSPVDDGEGFRFADELRRAPDTRRTPIVFVTSRFRGANHRAEARRRFAPAEYLETPVQTGELLARLAALISPLRESESPPSATGAGAVATAGARDAAVPPRDPDQQRERREVERRAKQLDAD